MEKQNKQEFPLSPGRAISPIDGRYHGKTKELSDIFSEFALMRNRVKAEVEYLIALDDIPRFGAKIVSTSGQLIIREIAAPERLFLRELYLGFSDENFQAIKEFEKKTNHDVKAVEYFIKAKLSNTSLADIARFVHFGLTSEDTNNLAYAFMLKEGVDMLYDNYALVAENIDKIAVNSRSVPTLGLTHGQSASPTTLGWIMHVFTERIETRLAKIAKLELLVKWGGATGGNNALCVAYPEFDWRGFAKSFTEGFNIDSVRILPFVYNEYTDQIEPHDTYADIFDELKKANTILISFAKNMWAYISREVFSQKAIAGEIGSSTMPQKINPINFENAEGNLGIANALFEHFSAKLPDTRQQRDLSDSTVERYFGVAFSCTLIALKSLNAGMSRLSVNHLHIYEELDNRWEVISEAYKIILEREGILEAYELMKELTRGKKITKDLLHQFVDQTAKKYKLSDAIIMELKIITPHNYIGDREIFSSYES